MMVLALQYRDLHRLTTQRLRGREPAETSTDDHYACLGEKDSVHGAHHNIITRKDTH